MKPRHLDDLPEEFFLPDEEPAQNKNTVDINPKHWYYPKRDSVQQK